ncbi:hypothetical protein CCP4SC76_1310004 [Gammaproteobacteria bacterium]
MGLVGFGGFYLAGWKFEILSARKSTTRQGRILLPTVWNPRPQAVKISLLH